ncbi:MAG: hypothetical protein KAQ71_06500, partial [Desulfobulbaceae bacterium]|nr:hypothetical protein [Desulfobulbaceae bacterium]
ILLRIYSSNLNFGQAGERLRLAGRSSINPCPVVTAQNMQDHLHGRSCAMSEHNCGLSPSPHLITKAKKKVACRSR